MKGTSPSPYPYSPKSRNLSRRRTLQKKQPYQFPCNINEFHFNLPANNYSLPITFRATQSDPFPKQAIQVNNIFSQQDQRRELIKQKIKFRVKQEMWSFMKKDSYRAIDTGYIPYVSQGKNQPTSFCMKYAESESPTVYVRGAASFVHINKEEINLRNKTVRSQRKNLSKSYFKESAKEKEGETSAAVKHKRVWSSFVKMKERDRVQLQRTKKQASHSMINIEKLDSCKIGPWKAFQDHEIGLDEH